MPSPPIGMFESFGRGIRKVASQFIDNINPIRTFGMQQRRKLAAEIGHSFSPAARASSTFSRKASRAHVAKDIPVGDRIKAYFNGYNMDDMVPSNMVSKSRMDRSKGAKSLYGQVAAKRATTRRITAGIAGAATVGSLVFGRDNMVSEAGVSGVTLGATGLAAAGIAGIGARAGKPGAGGVGAAALIGYTAINMYRSGDNLGPF